MNLEDFTQPGMVEYFGIEASVVRDALHQALEDMVDTALATASDPTIYDAQMALQIAGIHWGPIRVVGALHEAALHKLEIPIDK